MLDGVAITEDMRAVVERRWPELVAKLPPRQTDMLDELGATRHRKASTWVA